MHWLRARQISRGTDYRRGLIPERSLDQRRWWEAGYYAGTFGEYGMAAVRARGREKG